MIALAIPGGATVNPKESSATGASSGMLQDDRGGILGPALLLTIISQKYPHQRLPLSCELQFLEKLPEGSPGR